jgi:nucleoside-diphosphate-sugar epimerase
MRYGCPVQLKGSTLAITGATGFLGGYLVDNLLARGAHVVAVVRNPDKARPLAARGVEVRRADLSEPDALAQAFQGSDAVVSNAGLVAFTKPAETERTNVQGTQNVFEAIARAGVRRAICVSSTAAYPRSVFRLDERTPLRMGRRKGMLDAYAESKAAAERIAWELSEKHSIALTSVRPCGITGPDDPLLVRALETLFKLPIAPFPVLTQIGVVHAADVAEAVALALEHPERSVGKAYNLQGTNASLWQLGNAWKRAGGRAPWLRIPVPVPYALRFDDRRAREELGFQPRDVQSIFEEAVRARR